VVCAGGSQRACKTLAECKKQVLGASGGTTKRSRKGTEEMNAKMQENAEARAQRRADSDFGEMKVRWVK
jgi:hypothetical protein